MRNFYSTRIFFRFLWLINSIAIALGFRLSRTAIEPARVCIVPPPGSGNIGDQALFESVLWNTTGPATVYVRSFDDFRLPEWVERDRVEWKMAPHLLYSGGLRHVLAMGKLGLAARRYSSVYVVGADIMDGAYNPRASLNRWNLASSLGVRGIRSVVLGFSWNAAPNPSSLAALKEASLNCEVWVRDPASYERVVRDGVTSARLCADIVFRHPVSASRHVANEPTPSIPETLASDRKYGVVNMSALLPEEAHQLSQYSLIVDEMLHAGWEVVLLPHVRRPGNDDRDRLLKLMEGYDGRVSLVTTHLSPSAVHELVGSAEMVVTGRMHLAILATISGSPAVTLASQGKVVGLYQSLGRESWAIDPSSDFGSFVAEEVRIISLCDGKALIDEVAIDRLVELAGLPFGLSLT
ncbi:polysaccharide pyruvyl transferase family protein [Gordonia rubripertincta]|uniref:Polysaccharide pyruvyl transferase family protein n=2 Tax=Gordonia rubripertincta TaxID=36822 RepID=A0ABT4MXS6_GORRU|nr:polysaccharide pyruvyl transferase family protein [Gordonia rubripertincta]